MRKDITPEMYNYNKFPGPQFVTFDNHVKSDDIDLLLLENVKNAFDVTVFTQRFSDILLKYDYIVGDWGNEQLRLKGFYKEEMQGETKTPYIGYLDDYLKDDNMDDVLDSIKQQGTYDGKFYAFGYSESNVGVYYNKKMFKEAGIDEASLPTLEKPWTWSEFNAIAKKLKDHFNKPAIDFRLNSNDEMLPYAYMPLIWSNGGSVVNSKGTKAEGYFNSKESVEAVQFIQDLVKDGYTTVSPVEKGFETGEYPMVLSGSWTIADLQTNYKDIDFGILPYPVSDKTKKLVSPSGSWQLAVTTKSDKKEAAAEFVKFATNTESSEILSLGNSVLPIRKSTIKNIKDKVSEPMRFLMEQNAKTAHARPVVVAYPQVSRAFQQAMQDISYYKDNPDVQKVLDARAKEMQTAIDQSLNK